jgi:hypothetical protein
VVFPVTVWALGAIATFVPAINVTLLLPFAATANDSTSPTYGDDKLFTMSAALGRAIVSTELDVSKRNSMYWSN